MEGLAIGRIVHYVLAEGPSDGQCRPAIIVRVWNQETGMSNLDVFLDASNDGGGSLLMWATSISYAKGGLNSWHWPQECDEIRNSQLAVSPPTVEAGIENGSGGTLLASGEEIEGVGRLD
ncbi:MAG: hypothetical protein L0177_19665 [Chloroflexi bacterium]|nr:hypothetical protein [Chloroflexota bacterium]